MNNRRVFVLLAVLCLAAAFMSAQVAGSLSGSVVDPTGASVPNATVKLYLADGKQAVFTGATNAAGLFVFVAVRPDKYDVGVEAAGFGPVRVRGIAVQPITETSLAPVRVEVATTGTSIEVTADVQAIQTSNIEVSNHITNEQIQNLPVLGRQVTSLFLTQPGVSSGSDVSTVNGLRSSMVNITLDGINIQDNFIRTNALDYPPLRTTIDQISEITVTTSNASPELGGGAAQISMSTKSGSNDYHGSVYWYNRNSALAANNWFNNAAGVANSRLDLNQVGAAVGGRIIRDKLFFYVNPEFYRNKAQSSTLTTVLTDNARNGLFTYKDASGAVRTVNLLTLRNFAIDPTIKGMIAALPAGNTSDRGDGLNTTGYRFNAQSNENRNQIVAKGDYYLNSKNNFSISFNRIDNPTQRPDVGTFFTPAPVVANTIKDWLLSASWRITISPTLTNELRGGFLKTQTSFLDNNAYPKSIVAGLLFTNPVNTFLNQGRNPDNYHIQDNAHWVKGKHEVSFGFQTELLRIPVFNDAGILPTYTLGLSTANTTGLALADLPGANSASLAIANNLYSNLAGILTTAAQTFNVTSLTSGFVPGATNLRNFTQSTYAAYVKDNWKIAKTLTVNLGLRYEYWSPLDESNGLYLAPRLENNDPKATVLDPNAVLDFIGGPSGRPLYNASKNNFAPYAGVAYNVGGKSKTVIRGGYSLAYAFDNLATTVRNNVATANGLQFANTVTNLVATLANPPTVPAPPYKVPRTLADNYAISTTSAVGIPDPNLGTPRVHQWSIGIEHELKGAIFSARYVGNRAPNLMRVVDYNQVLYNANGFLADFQRAQSNASLALAATGSYNGSYNGNIAGSQPLTVFPLLGSGGLLTNATVQQYIRQGEVGTLADLYQTNKLNGPVNFYTNPTVQGGNVVTNSGHSTYNGLQLDVTKRTRSGLQAQFNYTFSKALSNTAGDSQTNLEPLLDNANPSLENARTPSDLRHVFNANYYYELPYGKGKRWSGNTFMNAVLGGWATSGIWTYASGAPYSILSGLGTLNRAARSTSTNTASINGATNLEANTSGVYMTGNGPYFLSTSLINTDGRGTNAFLSAPFPGQVFFNPNAGTLGNLQRRLFSGPWQHGWDASVKKSFKFGERLSADLHFDFFNVLNHPTFYVPPSQGDYGSQTNFNINNTTFGKITSMNFSPRRIQFGLYIRF